MNIGDYVRTKKRGFQIQQIARIKSMKKDSGYKNQYFIELDHNLLPDYEFQIYKEDVLKSSPNIIDLIEVGDFIGKTIVEEVKEFDDGTRIIVMADGFDEYDDNDSFLKAGIVTKEQFESVEYKL